MIWKIKPELNAINLINQNTLVSHLGIEITEIGDDYLKSKMPVDKRTKQPMGLLHGGASAVLSESMGSIASWMVVSDPSKNIVGIEINANHVKYADSGYVYGLTNPVKIGKTLHVWNTQIFNELGDLICVSRLTTMVMQKK